MPSIMQQFQGPLTSTLHGSRVHYWPAPADKPAATLLFIPGNPGLADYYIDYLSILHRMVNSEGNGALEIVCPSQMGHDPLATTIPTKLISLDEQVLEKARILETLANRWTGSNRPKMMMAGHSIGAWMALEVVRRGLNTTPVYSVHLLFPALHQMSQTPNAKKLAWLLQPGERSTHSASTLLYTLFAAIVALILRVVQVLPLPIVHFFVLLGAPTQPPSAVRTTTNFVLSSGCVQQALSMGTEEMNLVQAVQVLPSSLPGRDEVDVKLRAYWAAGDVDGWAPESTRRVVESTLGLQSYTLPQDILDKAAPLSQLNKTPRKYKGYSIEEIRNARLSKRRALAGMVRAGASASYGLASSLTQLRGYRRGAGGQPGAAPSSQGRRRRPSLMAAKASRRFDGTIYIEPADDALEDLLSSKESDSIDSLILDHSIDERQRERGSRQLKMPNRASIVCTHGFKHAFVLEHSEQMASISAAMIVADMSQ